MMYRVIVKTTNSVQPSGSFWQSKVLYCGCNRSEARQVYHGSAPADSGGSYGNRCRKTVMERIEDANTDDFADDMIEKELVV